MSTSRWLAWTPPKGSPIIEKVAETEPPKPTKVGFEGFAGDTSGPLRKTGGPITMSMAVVAPPAKEDHCRSRPFPHCPRCASYALYRANNIGNYECLTCGRLDIPEEVARRLQ